MEVKIQNKEKLGSQKKIREHCKIMRAREKVERCEMINMAMRHRKRISL